MCDKFQTPMTVVHILLECKKYENERKKHQLGEEINVALTAPEELSKCFQYLRDINIFNKI